MSPSGATQLLDFSEKPSIVTGAGSGIGRGCALLLAELGSSVCVVEREAEAAARTVESITGSGGNAFAVVGDARETSVAKDAVKQTIDRFGAVRVLVNNVGGMFPAAADDISDNGWSAIIRLTLDTTFHFCRETAPAMRSAGGGAIVSIASVAGIGGSPFSAHYGAAKAGVINLTQSLAVEWAPDVRVNAVAPDFIRTEGTDGLMSDAERERIAARVPMGRLGEPPDVARTVAFLASDLAAFVTGQTLIVDGGSLYRSRLDFTPTPD